MPVLTKWRRSRNGRKLWGPIAAACSRQDITTESGPENPGMHEGSHPELCPNLNSREMLKKGQGLVTVPGTMVISALLGVLCFLVGHQSGARSFASKPLPPRTRNHRCSPDVPRCGPSPCPAPPPAPALLHLHPWLQLPLSLRYEHVTGDRPS